MSPGTVPGMVTAQETQAAVRILGGRILFSRVEEGISFTRLWGGKSAVVQGAAQGVTALCGCSLLLLLRAACSQHSVQVHWVHAAFQPQC